MLKTILKKRADLQHFLYINGFLITDVELDDINEYPFYGNWIMKKVNSLYYYVHKNQKLYTHEKKGVSFFLIGHAYNPFTMQHDENEILNDIAEAFSTSKDMYFEKINELTGVFVLGYCSGSDVSFLNDCAGMQTVFYGQAQNNIYISSHSNLLGEVCGLEMDEYINNLISYRFYRLFGRTLPGDMSPYSNIKRVIPNTYVSYIQNKFEVDRFYPKIAIYETKDDAEYNDMLERSAKILHNNLILIPKKWEHPAISLTGGCDSKTTLSCANGLYDKYTYFSYVSTPEERVDAEAAKKISERLELKHKTHYILPENDSYSDYEIFKKILRYNTGNIGNSNSNDIRKRIYYIENKDFDVEVKSWVSEIARAYYYKRFAKKSFPKRPTPRYCSALYKVFVNKRKLLYQTDEIFKEYLTKYYDEAVFNKISWVDLFFWEFRVGSWNGLVISGEHNISFDITIPYNNRKLLELMLSAPLEKRINDTLHKDIMKLMNKAVHYTGISVTNVKHTRNRAFMEKCYLNINAHIPF